MRKLTSLVIGLIVGGSALAGGVASADEHFRGDGDRIVNRPVVERRVEVRHPDRAPPEAPREAYGNWRGRVWASGDYRWINGRYIYMPGRYITARRGYHWVSADWAHRGHRYVRIPGHWARG